ncbi:hypothetical protein MMC11_002116 [Xylographa trunciseda]|nr:hypothetical protein [Xylographa trunciseda]
MSLLLPSISSLVMVTRVPEAILTRISAFQLVFLCLFASALAMYIGFSVVSWYRLRQFKGPWFAGFSELWLGKAGLSGQFGEVLDNVNREYGQVARIGPNDLITDNADIIRYMSGSKGQGYDRSGWYRAFTIDPELHHLFSTPDLAYHDKLRAQMIAGYTKKENPGFEASIDEQVISLTRLIEGKYLSSESETKRMDLGKIIQYFTLDVITKLSFGYAFGFLVKDGDVYEYLASFAPSIPFITLLSLLPALRQLVSIQWIMTLLSPSKDDAKGFGKLLRLCEELVQERVAGDEKSDMLGSFMRHGLTPRELEKSIMVQLVAGSDTSAATMGGTLLHLITNTRVLQRLRHEMDAAVSSGKISRPVIQASEAKQLPYLQACVREGLRANVPLSPGFAKVVPKGGDTLAGRYVPGGTRVYHNTRGVLRNKEVFGDDVDVYRPERWLNDELEGKGTERGERMMRMLKDIDLNFGYGKWGCLGRVVAEHELNKIYFELLYRYDFTVINASKPCTRVEYIQILIKDFWVRVSLRK